MTPDPATIAKRRHLVTMLLRGAIFVFAAWTIWDLCAMVTNAAYDLLATGMFMTQIVVGPLVFLAPRVIAIVGALVLEKRIVRWIVPMPSAEPQCPRCGYSLRNLKSPICPECGTNLRSGGVGGNA